MLFTRPDNQLLSYDFNHIVRPINGVLMQNGTRLFYVTDHNVN